MKNNDCTEWVTTYRAYADFVNDGDKVVNLGFSFHEIQMVVLPIWLRMVMLLPLSRPFPLLSW